MLIAIWHNLPSGGGRRWLHDSLRALASMGHEIEVWCPDTADTGFLPLHEFAQEHVRALVPARIPRWKRRGNPIVEMNARVAAMKDHCRQVAQEIDASGADVLLATSCRSFYVPYIGLFSQLPKLVYLHEPYRPLYEAQPELIWKAPPRLTGIRQGLGTLRQLASDHCKIYAARIQAREEYAAVSSYNRILTNSLFNRESVLRAYGLESEVCYPGVDTGAFPIGTTDPGQYVAGMGSVSYHKGIGRILRAIASIAETRRPELRWIANHVDAAHEGEIRELARSLGVRMELLIQVDDARARMILSGAALFLYAPRLEPFGLSPLEANACGIPVVAVAEGGVRETIQDGVNGVLVPSASPAVLGAEIDRLLSDPEARQALASRARSYVSEHWSIEKATRILEHHMLDLIKTRTDSHV